MATDRAFGDGHADVSIRLLGPDDVGNEVGVAEPFRRRGIGRALLRVLFDDARISGCVEAWVLTERDNGPALRLYDSLGGVEPPEDVVMFSFSLAEESDPDR